MSRRAEGQKLEDTQKAERRRRIEAAALEVLAEVGFKKASMLQIAKRAKASNETLYAWYGSKQALFASIIEENSKSLKEALSSAALDADDPRASLTEIATLLLAFIATEKAIIVNRAAIADVSDTGLLAKAIQEHARHPILERLTHLMREIEAVDATGPSLDPATAADAFISLLLGEIPTQQALGEVGPLSESDIALRAETAVAQFGRLFLEG